MCIECEFPYHVGKCSGLTEQAVNKKTFDKKSWKCATCTMGALRSRQAPENQMKQIQDQLTGITKSLSCLSDIKNNVDKLLSMKDTVDSIESAVEMLSSKYDEILQHMTENDKEIKDMKKRVTCLENRKDNEGVEKVRSELNRLDQYSRRNNLEIHGLKQCINEDLFQQVNQIATALQLSQLNRENVEAIHRLPTKPEKIPPVIVRFVNRHQRDEWLESRRRLRSTAGTETIYFQDNLTEQNRKLFWMARIRAKERSYAFVWTTRGTIYVRKNPDQNAIRIDHEDDLNKIQ